MLALRTCDVRDTHAFSADYYQFLLLADLLATTVSF